MHAPNLPSHPPPNPSSPDSNKTVSQPSAAVNVHKSRLTLLMLILFLLLLFFAGETPLINLRHVLFDYYQRILPRDREAAPALVVAIDEKSLRLEGQWPWPHSRLAQLVRDINQQQPLALGLDIVFPEADRLAPGALQNLYPELPSHVLERLPDPDDELANAMSIGNTILGVFATNQSIQHVETPRLNSVPVVSQGGDATQYIGRYPANLPNLQVLANAASGQGLLNAAPDPERFGAERGVIRRMPLLTSVSEHPIATLGLEMLRTALDKNTPLLTQVGGWPHRGTTRVAVGNYVLHTEPSANFLLHFGEYQHDRYVSAADILTGAFDLSQLSGRFVLIGFTALGLRDNVLTPLGEIVPGVDIHVQMLESILNNQSLRRPSWMTVLEMAVFSLFALLLFYAVPRLQPRYTAGLGALIPLALIVSGLLAFRYGHWLFDGISITVLLTPIFIWLLRTTLVDIDQRRLQAERALQASQLSAARIAGELSAARRIQFGMLPDPKTRFEGEQRFSVASLLHPAKEVSGDYYDCFMLDEHRLCIAIGDVAGKGVPASLFMSIAKTLSGTFTRQTGGNLGESLQQVEAELNRANPESLFVTSLIAMLEVDNGKLHLACAGHDAPYLLRSNRAEQLGIDDVSGPPLCALGDYPFGRSSLQLQPGDLLCLFTDGISEATDGKGFYGNARIHARLESLPADAGPEVTLEAIQNDVVQFVGDAPASDDMTMIALKWYGPGQQADQE